MSVGTITYKCSFIFFNPVILCYNLIQAGAVFYWSNQNSYCVTEWATRYLPYEPEKCFACTVFKDIITLKYTYRGTGIHLFAHLENRGSFYLVFSTRGIATGGAWPFLVHS